MRKSFARDVGALLVCVYCGGCATLQNQAFRELDVIVDAAAIGGGLQSQHFDLDLAIYNPNYYRLDASRIRYTLNIDSLNVASGTIDRRVTLKPRDSATVRVPVDVDRRTIGPLVARLIFTLGQKPLPFRLEGEMRIETIFGGVTRTFVQVGEYDPIREHITIFKRKK